MNDEHNAEPAMVLVPREPTQEMITAYLTANDAYWRRTDELPRKPNKWRNGTPNEATAESYKAMLAAAPKSEPVKPEAVPAHDNLRDNIGQALADKLTEWSDGGCVTFDPFDAGSIDALADAVIVALSTQEAVPPSTSPELGASPSGTGRSAPALRASAPIPGADRSAFDTFPDDYEVN